LDRLVDHRQQLALQGVQVNLIPEPGREPLHGPRGVVAAAVKAPVDHPLDAVAQRLEQRRGGQGGGGRPTGGRNDQHIGDHQQGSDQRVGHGAADQPVQVPEAIASAKGGYRRQRVFDTGNPF
jgi:hypothetical protein